MSGGDLLLVVLVVVVPAALLWGVFLARARGRRRPERILGIPQAMRPGQPDEALEGSRLERLQWGGVVAVVALAAFIPLYWLPEKPRQETFTEEFEEASVERGRLIFQAAPPLPEDIDPAQFKEIERELALGMGCANCHGGDASGGFATPAFKEPTTGKTIAWVAPPLNNVFTRWDDEVVRLTIQRGRPGTPMPTWGIEFGGPMTEQMIDDVMNWLKTLPGNQEMPKLAANASGKEIFQARCAVCHGDKGQGREDPKEAPVPGGDVKGPVWYPGMALWKGDVRHLSIDQHFITINNGRRFAWMPQFSEAPPQGIPVPPAPLTDKQMRAVMRYERTL